MSSHLSKAEIEADAVAELRDEGMPIVGVNLKTAERLFGIPSTDLIRAIARGDIAARNVNGRVIVLYESAKHYVLALPAMELR